MRKMTKQDFLKSFKNQTYVNQLEKIERKLDAKVNEASNNTEITIYGVIGDSWWDDSVSASDIDNLLKDITGDIVINLNSPGGDAFDGIAIYNRLKKHDGKVTVNIDGWACSAASVIAMAGDTVNMGLGAMLMIHEASSLVWGTKKEMRKEADVLDQLEEGIIDIYMTKANVSREEIRQMVDAETWFSASKAKEIGFATVIETKEDEVTNLRNQITDLQNELQQYKNQNQAPQQPPVNKGSRRVLY
ncbi:head maturation protease, ClpP-related [Paenibacillus bouchesdurhonensis]|uniref:head maturation protease, ClpP-related n=1 Tax=Paenibacillus bouchesdurhonensis TaxID=1870990 RepID=UPI000DA60880|nr:head maturation protease, ClpP-related [Paenibacillus bouchesdurhonensis]